MGLAYVGVTYMGNIVRRQARSRYRAGPNPRPARTIGTQETSMATVPAAATEPKPLPPGRLGLPWIGETLPFLKDSFGFFAARKAEHGPVFKTRLLGDTVVCLVGPEAVSFFYDPRYFTRVGASPPQLQEILHPEAIPFIDQSPEQVKRRQLLLKAFTPEALSGYVPFLERIVRRY